MIRTDEHQHLRTERGQHRAKWVGTELKDSRVKCQLCWQVADSSWQRGQVHDCRAQVGKGRGSLKRLRKNLGFTQPLLLDYPITIWILNPKKLSISNPRDQRFNRQKCQMHGQENQPGAHKDSRKLVTGSGRSDLEWEQVNEIRVITRDGGSRQEGGAASTWSCFYLLKALTE